MSVGQPIEMNELLGRLGLRWLAMNCLEKEKMSTQSVGRSVAFPHPETTVTQMHI